MAKERLPKIEIESAQITFRNFTGKAMEFNTEGDRNFFVFLDPEVAKQLEKDGWNIRYLSPRDEGDEPRPGMKVKVSYKGRPPKIMLMTANGRSFLNENTVEMLDWAEIENIDLVIEPYQWKLKSGKEGVTAYLQTMYVTIKEDRFAAKYYNSPDPDELPV